MRKQLLPIFFFISTIFTATAQLPDAKRYPKPAERLKAVNAFCSKMLQTERYDSLLMAAKIGYDISRTGKDAGENSVLCYYIGAGYGSLAKTDSSIYYYKLSEQYGTHTGMPERVINAQARVLEQAPRNSELKREYFAKLEQAFNKYKNQNKLTSEIAGILAVVYNDETQFENSLKYHFLDLAAEQRLKDSTGVGTTLVNIGNTYIQMGNHEKALQYLKESLPYLNNYKRGQMMAYYNIAANYMDLSKTDAAIANFQKSNNIAKSVNDTAAMYSIQQKLGMAYTEKKQYAKAEAMLVPSTKYAEQINDLPTMSDGYQALGDLYFGKKDYPLATMWLLKALQVSKKANMKERAAEIYQILAKVEAGAGNFAKAYQYQMQYALVKDTLTKESTKKNLVELDTKFQTEKKQQQINLLNQKGKTQAAELESQRRTRYLLIGGLIAVMVIVGLMVRGYRVKQSANLALAGKNIELEEKNHTLNMLNEQLDEANQSKAKLFGILSHDLRAPVGSLFQFLSLQKNSAGKLSETQKLQHNERIIASAENLMGSMEDLLIWSKSQMESFAPQLQEVTTVELVDETMELHANFAKTKQINMVKDSVADVVIKTDLNFLKIVLRNITSNGIKFTPAGGTLTFKAEEADNAVIFSIADTGPGISEAQLKSLFEWSSIRSDSSGMGLRLAKEFTERLGGKIRVESEVGKGTIFFVEIET
ncbi:MAG: tetratricopeptide repeat-containing sensor histidine kinase [Mucilaginibacter sp.]